MSDKAIFSGQPVWVKMWHKNRGGLSGYIWVPGLYRGFYPNELRKPHLVQLTDSREYRYFCNIDMLSEDDYANMALVQ